MIGLDHCPEKRLPGMLDYMFHRARMRLHASPAFIALMKTLAARGD